MPQGSLSVNIQPLDDALRAVEALRGQPPSGDDPGTGLSGAAGLLSTSPASLAQALGGQLTTQLTNLLHFDASASLSGTTDFFTQLRTQAQAPPTQALAGFQQHITQAGAAFSGDFAERLQQGIDAVRGISQGVPPDHTAIVSGLLDQILAVIASMQGPEAEMIRSWVQTTTEMFRVLMPVIEEAQQSPDPAAFAIEAVTKSLGSTLEVFGFSQASRLVNFLDGFLTNPVAPGSLDGVTTATVALSANLGQTLTLVGGDFTALRDQVAVSFSAMQDVKARLRPILTTVHHVAEAKILQPGALERFLREQMDRALEVNVVEVQRIDDPFKALFDRIDAAINGIDLSFVRTEVLGFFESTRDTIEQVDIGSLGEMLQQQLAAVQGTVEQLQQGVADLLAQIQAFFDNLTGQARTLAGQVGQFQPDGSFRFNFEQDLRSLFTTARAAIGGDPQHPERPSVMGTLTEWQSNIDQFLGRISELLGPVEEAIDGVTSSAVAAIGTFREFLLGLDIPALMLELQARVREVLDALAPVDFAVVTDPVVAAIEENTEKLRAIDTSSLNDLLREALKVALDVIISIDFTVAVSDPLKEQFEEIKKVPAEAITQLQQRYLEAIQVLDALNPEQLLEALFAAFDTIDQAVGSLNAATLLDPLDQLHEQHLQLPLAQLKPSQLLQPLSDAFQESTAVIDQLQGSAVLAPVDTALNELKAAVTGFNVSQPIDDLLAAVERVKQDLRAIRPSGLLQPLVADFARLEAELDRFSPSVIFQPVVELAAPLLQFLENVQQQTVAALHQAFQIPLQLLERLRPEALTQFIVEQLDVIIGALRSLNLPVKFTQLKAQYFDLKAAAQVEADGNKLSLVLYLDPQVQLGEFVTGYADLIAILEGLKQNVQLTSLAELYTTLRERLLSLLPPYARELLDPETFKRIMRLADPTRFLAELDQRFQALKDKLLPIRPEDITAELDATYDAVLALVDQLDIEDSLNQVKQILDSIKGTVTGIRVDFLTADIDRAVADFRAMVGALDPARLFADLDEVHHELELVVQSTLPSQVLAGLGALLDDVKGIVSSVNPRTKLGPPLGEAWGAVEGALAAVDFTVVLQPVTDKLDELEAAFEVSLRRTEDAFDAMLTAGKAALGGGGAAGASASVGVSI